jgi:hypothetical protein
MKNVRCEDFLEGFPTVSGKVALEALDEAKQLLLMRLLIDECVDERLRLLSL